LNPALGAYAITTTGGVDMNARLHGGSDQTFPFRNGDRSIVRQKCDLTITHAKPLPIHAKRPEGRSTRLTVLKIAEYEKRKLSVIPRLFGLTRIPKELVSMF
jgi:hypothetical protein